MGFADYLNSTYNVLSQATNLTIKMGNQILSSTGVIKSSSPDVKLPDHLKNLDISKLVHNGGIPIKIAAVAGACAVILGAYGAHTLPKKEDFEERLALYERANRYHFYHLLGLMGASLTKYPGVVVSLHLIGMILFSGTIYYHAFTGDKRLRNLTPAGGVFLILGWLSMLL